MILHMRHVQMNIKELQITPISKKELQLHKKHGHSGIEMVRGAGKLYQPDIMLVFMNPTTSNVSSNPNWQGLRAPWIGTKHVWGMLSQLRFINKRYTDMINSLRSEQWTEVNAIELYQHVANRNLFITNLASCTQPDARPLPNSMFKEYLPVMFKEIETVNPSTIITFGNQVSSILLQKNISVSNYLNKEAEVLKINDKSFNIYPTYYPVGQGRRNMPKAMKRIKLLLSHR